MYMCIKVHRLKGFKNSGKSNKIGHGIGPGMAEDRFFLFLLSSISCSKERLLGVPSGCLGFRYFFGVLFPFGLEKTEVPEKTKRFHTNAENTP